MRNIGGEIWIDMHEKDASGEWAMERGEYEFFKVNIMRELKRSGRS